MCRICGKHLLKWELLHVCLVEVLSFSDSLSCVSDDYQIYKIIYMRYIPKVSSVLLLEVIDVNMQTSLFIYWHNLFLSA
jgi:hypothetical protein